MLEVSYATDTAKVLAVSEYEPESSDMRLSAEDGVSISTAGGTLNESTDLLSTLQKPVWDGSQIVEGASEAEILAEAKIVKDRELTTAAYAAFDAIFQDGWRELAYVIAVNDQARIKQGKDVMQRLKDLREQVAGAKTVAEVEAASWN